jgi:NagD protein
MRTVLVLSGIMRAEAVDRYPYRPHRVVGSIAELVDEI